jgi:hypothetical protein
MMITLYPGTTHTHTLTHPTHTLFLQPIRFLSLRLVNKSRNIFLFLNLARWRWRSPKTEKFSGIKIISDEADLFCVCVRPHISEKEKKKKKRKEKILLFSVLFSKQKPAKILAV